MRRLVCGLVLLGAGAASLGAQNLPPDLADIAAGLSGQPPYPPSLTAVLKAWEQPAEPVTIVGPIHFVGTRALAAYLITTPSGHILLDGAMPNSGPAIEASIRKLGFQPEDIQLLLITHPHIDHAGTLAYFKKLSGAPAAVMDRDFEVLKDGGKSDFRYGKQPGFAFPGVTAERRLKDGDTVSVGNVTLTARLGSGHTRGATTWITSVEDGGRTYNVVFPCCTSINPGYRLTVNPSYPGIADDYRRTIAMLESLHPDIWLPAHTDFFGFDGKRLRAARQGVQAWVDPDGYRRFVAEGKAKLDAWIAKEKATPSP